MALSPIQKMIDQATGYKPGSPPPPGWVNIRCPKCKRTKRVGSNKTDPPNTVTVEVPCPKCDVPGDRPETMYFDAQDRQLHPQTGKPFSKK